jgi:hypothetical protein
MPQGLPVSADRRVLLAVRGREQRSGEGVARVTRRRGWAARLRRHEPKTPGRYGLLLFLLIVTYLLSAFTSEYWVGGAQLALFGATGLLALRSSDLPRRRAWVIGSIGLVGSVAAVVLSITRPSDAAVGAASIWTGLLLLATVVVIVRRILSFDVVTIQSIFAAVSSYLLIGLMYAAFYAAIYRLHGNQFFAGHRPSNSQTFQYFSFTTLTTLGYGDFTAAGSGGRAIAMLEALSGQVFLATLVARLVAAFRAPGPRNE